MRLHLTRQRRGRKADLSRWLTVALVLLCGSAGAGAADYVSIGGGSFISVLPQGPLPEASAPVQIESFSLRRTPVTAGEFQAFVLAHPEWQRGLAPAIFADQRYLIDWRTPTELADPQAAEGPVTNVSWFAAKAFCESENARLPTWLEWEFAAAADADRLDARADPQWRQRILAWYERPTAARLPPTGGAPNAWGVSDLHGLVWEWVEDFNALFIAGDSRTQGDPDTLKFCGAGAISIIDRDSYAVLMRIALLSSLAAADTTSSLGFRCAR
ncbi:MAG: formylglycine-generating enzyme family protein [Caldimonas sp.]